MDFTIKTYKRLLQAMLDGGYSLLPYETYCLTKEQLENNKTKFVILRHDVDEYAENALEMAKVERDLGVNATYYFRKVKQSDKPNIIREIASYGHEIGYHYEDLAFAKGDLEVARKTFQKNLAYFRTYYPVKTVCMHGSSTSKYDNREFWKVNKLTDFDLIAEPYLSTDFNKIFYITDTGYAWDGGKYAIRDVVKNKSGLTFHSSDEIIQSIEKGEFPNQCLMLAHTLWSPNLAQWLLLHTREFLRNNLKYMAQHNKFLNKLYSKMVKAYWKR